MRIVECEQRSKEWIEVRCGIPTASGFSQIVTCSGEPSKQRTGYLYTLAAERLSGVCESTYMSLAMLQGIEREQESREVYAMIHEVTVLEVGFCLEDGGRYGCSPDGLVEENGLFELKNPIGKTAIEYLLSGKFPTTYFQQVQGQLLITGREWCDFVSYYPSLPRFEIRIFPDRSFQGKLRDALEEFCDELDAITGTVEAVRHELEEKAALEEAAVA